MGRSLLEAANKPRNLVETQQAPLPNSQSSRRDASTPSAADMGDAGLALWSRQALGTWRCRRKNAKNPIAVTFASIALR